MKKLSGRLARKAQKRHATALEIYDNNGPMTAREMIAHWPRKSDTPSANQLGVNLGRHGWTQNFEKKWYPPTDLRA